MPPGCKTPFVDGEVDRSSHKCHQKAMKVHTSGSSLLKLQRHLSELVLKTPVTNRELTWKIPGVGWITKEVWIRRIFSFCTHPQFYTGQFGFKLCLWLFLLVMALEKKHTLLSSSLPQKEKMALLGSHFWQTVIPMMLATQGKNTNIVQHFGPNPPPPASRSPRRK